MQRTRFLLKPTLLCSPQEYEALVITTFRPGRAFLLTWAFSFIILCGNGMAQESEQHSISLPPPHSSTILIAKQTKSTSRRSPSIAIRNIRFAAHDGYTRVVLDLPRKRAVSKPQLTTGRVTLTLPNTQLGKSARKRLSQKNFPRGLHITEQSNKTLSIMLDRAVLEKYKLQTLNKPYRIVLDLYYAPTQKDLPSFKNSDLDQRDSPRIDLASQPLAMAQPTAVAPLAQTKSFKDLLVVIDPGHGGKDPGAVGKKGTREKEITLRISTLLQSLLKNRLGTQVLLTRNKDTFLELEDRVAFANGQKADLFVSIHVNSHTQKSIKGLEIYHFGKASDPRALEVAARENGMTLEENAPPWQFIIADKLNDQKIQESQNFAWTTRETLMKSLTRSFKVKDHGVKTAPFYVLRFTTMPSILTEVAFVSNPTEEKRLRSSNYQKSLAEGMYKGIRAYLKSLYPDIS